MYGPGFSTVPKQKSIIMKNRITITTGGTAGHIYPMLGLYEHLIQKGYVVNFITDHRGKKYFTPSILDNVKILKINSPFNLKGLSKILSFFYLFYACIYSVILLIVNRPNLVIGSGGYASFPILTAASLLRINIIIYETNIILGKTNKIFYNSCKKLLVGCDDLDFFPKKFHSKAAYVGQLVRSAFLADFERKNLKDRLVILVIGGSQSSEFFGTNLAKAFSDIDKNIFPLQIYHQCKFEKFNEIENAYGDFKNYKLFEFDSNIRDLMQKSNLAITRSGSSTLSEMVAVNLPFIAVPLPSSLDNHQFYNAKYYEKKGCCWVLEQNFFNEDSLKKIILEIIKNNREQLDIKIRSMKLINMTNAIENFESEINKYL